MLLILVLFVKVGAQNWDVEVTKSINPENPASGFWRTTSWSAYFVSGAVPLFILTDGIIKNDPLIKRKAYKVFGAILIELIISESMKDVFKRDRPAQAYLGIVFPYRNVTGRSFPSGHTSLVFATAASLSLQFKKWYITVPAYAWAAAVGYSRIYLGVHYPTDVLAGSFVGAGSAYLSNWLNKKIFLKGNNGSASKNNIKKAGF